MVAGRNVDAARAVAAGLGGKGRAQRVDASDEAQVASAAKDADILVNAAGPDYHVALPALRAAIETGTHYCDLCVDGLTTEKLIGLDPAARAADITALTGIGAAPGLTNLMMLHAARQLDEVEELQVCWFFPLAGWGDPSEMLATMRRTGRVDASWESLFRAASGTARVYRDGDWAEVDSLANPVDIRLPQGGEVTAYPMTSNETITFPRRLPRVKKVTGLMAMFPSQLNRLFQEHGRRMVEGMDATKTAMGFFETVLGDPRRWLSGPEGFPTDLTIWAVAIGRKEGRSARYACWPASNWLTTSGSLVLAALKILQGKVRERGVLAPEACLEPLPYFSEVARLAVHPPPEEGLLGESLEWLDER